MSGYIGLLVSFHFDLPSGPAIVLTAGVIYLASMAVGTHGSLRQNLIARPHYES
ncbi:MAG TPA: metal ABC transporter permease [Candidatus Angelobacter sp.]|nr:metal ABC transporter permease [Candidatus Angelobacter sp.]